MYTLAVRGLRWGQRNCWMSIQSRFPRSVQSPCATCYVAKRRGLDTSLAGPKPICVFIGLRAYARERCSTSAETPNSVSYGTIAANAGIDSRNDIVLLDSSEDPMKHRCVGDLHGDQCGDHQHSCRPHLAALGLFIQSISSRCQRHQCLRSLPARAAAALAHALAAQAGPAKAAAERLGGASCTTLSSCSVKRSLALNGFEEREKVSTRAGSNAYLFLAYKLSPIRLFVSKRGVMEFSLTQGIEFAAVGEWL
jgi:hypothetical protein